MKQLSLSPFCPRKLSVEWEIKPSSDFLVLKVMATKKRSNNLFFFFQAALDGVIVQNHPPQWSQNKALLQKKWCSRPAAQISFSQHSFLALS